MKDESAAGRKTDHFESAARRLEEQMETQLELLTGAMRGSVARADTADGDDEYGHRRSSHIGEAVKIGGVSAQIVVALGKYAGEFNHNITVKRADEDAAEKRYVVEVNSNPKIRRVYPSREAYEQSRAAHEASLSRTPLPPDHWLMRERAREDAERAAQAAATAPDEALMLDSPEGVPPAEIPGSNG